jgi:acetylornithine/N-succinyldiaminopimelate aminotransferase
MDSDGKRYMDLESGVWCISIGHANSGVNATIIDQIGRLTHSGFNYNSPVVDEAAQKILEISGHKNGRCVFLCSGSEAIEIARQIARHTTGFTQSMTLHDSYLGSYSSVLDRSRNWYVFNWERCAHCTSRETCDHGCELLQQIPREIADFVFEPGSSSGFVRFPPKALIKNISNIVHENGGKVIANEVTTGIGRTGKWFGHHHYDMECDLIAMGKGLGNGYPVSAASINAKTVRQLDETNFHYSQSHQNDPLGAAVAKEVIRQISDNNLIAKAEQNGAVFLLQLQSLVDGKFVLKVRGRGLMFALELANTEVARYIYDALLAKGFLVGLRGDLFRIDPPLILVPEEFDGFIAAFKDIIARMKD